MRIDVWTVNAFREDQTCPTLRVRWNRTPELARFHGFAPEVLEVERETTRFASVAEGLAAAVGLEDKWRADGRWFRFLAFLEEGGRTLTRAHVIVKARRS